MSFLSNLADKSFKVDENGRTVFFPWGYFGKGYMLDDKSEEKRIRRAIITGNAVGLSLVFIIGVILRLWIVALLLFPFVIVVWSLLTKMYTRGLEISEMEYSINSNSESTTLRIDNPTRAMKISIIVQWVLIVTAVLVGIYEERYLPELLKSYINEQDSNPLSISEMAVMGSALFFVLGLIISSVGLYRLKTWARTAYVAFSVLGAILSLLMGPTVTPPVEGAFQYIADAATGFTIALLYFSSARINFESSNENAREGR